MLEISRQQLVVYAAALLAVALIGARYLKSERDPPAQARAAPVKVARSKGSAAAVVHVVGAVRRPGVYRLPAWSRLAAALRRAGGATGRADLQGVNLAAKVSDGQQVIVPARVAGASGAAGAAVAATPGQPVSLNNATVEQLDELDGIGPATAQKILDYRQEHGGFSSVEDLKEVSGIGPKRYESLKEQVRM
ncbi:MAG TPA: helix-hairpin-helix domain-containing protein [Solirubrobacterales bacterium]|nr:helix-hairpin-helix domain-containing protein [Solirubrobacterales bacterium]